MITFTPNLNLELPANGADVGTWDVPVNGDFSAIDSRLGNLLSLPLTENVALTVSQLRCCIIELSGTLTSSLTITTPAGVGGTWTVFNGTSGDWTVSFSSAGLANSVLVGQGISTIITCDGNLFFLAQETPAGSIENTDLAPMNPLTIKSNLNNTVQQPADNAISTVVAAMLPSIITQISVANPGLFNVIGSITMYGFPTAPLGYLLCDGSAVSRTTFANLFSIIGTVFGTGDGSTTFNVPDFRGIFPRGWDDGAGRDPGRAFGTFQADTFTNHTHELNIANTGVGGLSGLVGSNSTGTNQIGSGTVEPPNDTGTETRPKNLSISFIIKT